MQIELSVHDVLTVNNNREALSLNLLLLPYIKKSSQSQEKINIDGRSMSEKAKECVISKPNRLACRQQGVGHCLCSQAISRYTTNLALFPSAYQVARYNQVSLSLFFPVFILFYDNF